MRTDTPSHTDTPDSDARSQDIHLLSQGLARLLRLARSCGVMLGMVLSALLVCAPLALAPVSAHAQAQRIYVDANAAPGGDGDSWSSAYATLQAALNDPASEEGGSIHIAEGIYVPDEGPGVTDGDRTARFELTGAQAGLSIYGGFENGDRFSDRSPADHPVILSGDIGGDDTVNSRGVTLSADDIAGGNSYHVLYLDGRTVSAGGDGPIDPSGAGPIRIEGVTITGGDATDVSGGEDHGGGLYCNGSSDGGLCGVEVRRTVFAGNSARLGGAVFLDAFEDGQGDAFFENTVFTGNTASSSGGALYAASVNNGSANRGIDLRVELSTFTGNSASTYGGAFYNNSFSGFVDASVVNSIIYGNAAGGSDTASIDGDQVGHEGENTSLDISHTLIEGGRAALLERRSATTNDQGGLLDADPRFGAPGGPDGFDDTFATADDGLRLAPGSPAVDAGDNDAVYFATDFDLTGAERIQDGTVDLGAYEGSVDLEKVIHVDAAAASGGNGTSWRSAYTDLQDALAEADSNDEIWIAEGTYTPGTSRDDSFTITGNQDGLKVYGGFAGDETQREERDPVAHETILSGDIDGSGRGGDSRHVLFIDGGDQARADVEANVTPATLLDGVTVTAGNASNSPSRDGEAGGGLYCDGNGVRNECSPTLRNVIFAGNNAFKGAAIYNYGSGRFGGKSNPVIINATFVNNSAFAGGAIYNAGSGLTGGESNPIITNAVFVGNRASPGNGLGNGGAIYNEGQRGGQSNPTIINATFTANHAANRGGAIYNDVRFGDGGESRPQITNSILFGNTAGGSPSQVEGDGASPQITFSIVEGGGSSGTGNLDADPRFTAPFDPVGPDGTFATADDGLRLAPGSPALDAGTSSEISLPNEDLTGADRVQNGTVDLGAYEGEVNLESIERRFYVDASSGGGNGGLSWADPLSSLQAALSFADGNDEIWIAEGTYTPGGSRDDSFTITGDQDGLEIYGGFRGNETSRSERDPVANETILSGDLNGDDADSDGDGIADQNRGENSYHVLVFDGGNGIGPNVDADVTTATVLAGVTVSGGNADGSNFDSQGGGLYCDGQSAGNACSPALTDVRFASNRALGAGGAIYNDGADGASSPVLTNAIFTDNRASGGGGAIYNNGAGGVSSPVLTNAIFTGNQASGSGGAVLNDGREAGSSDPVLTHVTFTGNSAEAAGGAVFNRSGSSGAARPQITNSILAGNSASAGGDEIDGQGGASPQVTFSLVAGGFEGTGNVTGDPFFVDADSPAGPDGVFATADDGLRLTGRSPAVGAGNNDAIPAGVTTDLTGAPRVQNGTVDLGAYENALTTFYVDASATGTEDGSSWTDAYTDLQDALDEADGDDEIWIAEGTYTPTAVPPGTFRPDDERKVSFLITGEQDGLKVYGGFAGDETQRDQRDPAAHETILSGDLDGDDVDSDGDGIADQNRGENSYNVLILNGGATVAAEVAANVTAATVIDGVTITAGYAEEGSTWANDDGGGLYCDGRGNENACSPTLRGITFIGNHVSSNGGAIYNDGESGGESSPTITNVLFIGNSAAAYGGAIYNATDGSNSVRGESSPVITNTLFVRNSTGRDGGALYNDGRVGGDSSPVITNTVFIGNSAADYGGALYNDGSVFGKSSPVITNTTFTQNSASVEGGALYNDAYNDAGSLSENESRPDITNSILFGNSAPDGAEMASSGVAAPQVAFSLIEGGCTSSADCATLISGVPAFVDATTPAGSDGTFATSDDGLRLVAGSRALDAGTDSGASLPEKDLTGADRVQNGAVDLGAYEGADRTGPILSTVAPTAASPGRTISIEGSNLANATAVTIGDATVSYEVQSSTRITATVTPGLSSGPAPVVVETTERTSAPLDFRVAGTPSGSGQALVFTNNDFDTRKRVSAASDGFADASAYTMSAWVRPEGDINQPVSVLAFGFDIVLYHERESFGYIDANTGFQEANVASPTGTWYHVAATVAPDDRGVLYIDGQEAATFTTEERPSATDGFAMGHRGNGDTGNAFFEGRIDEVRLWTEARTPQQIRASMHQTLTGDEENLASYWRFDADDADVVYDHAGSALGSLGGTPVPQRDVSGAGLGQAAGLASGGADVTVGPSGGTVQVLNTGPSDADPLAVYQYGAAHGDLVAAGAPGEDFGDVGVTQRLNVVWGIEPVAGSSASADVTFDFSGLSGVSDPGAVLLLKREAPGAPWQDVTASWVLDPTAQTFSRSGVSSFSEYAIAGDAQALPVELAGFEAQRSGNDAITVQWQTLSETNNAGFEVQRAAASADDPANASVETSQSGVSMTDESWQTVATLEGAGTTDTPQSYRFEDTDLPYEADSLSYRLRQVDTDGTESFSEAITIARQVTEAELLPTYPNPTGGQAIVRYAVPERQAVRIVLYDLLGRRVQTVVDTDAEGRTEAQLDVSGLASGTYFLRMQTDGHTETQRITVVR